jgi:hypothetical protein
MANITAVSEPVAGGAWPCLQRRQLARDRAALDLGLPDIRLAGGPAALLQRRRKLRPRRFLRRVRRAPERRNAVSAASRHAGEGGEKGGEPRKKTQKPCHRTVCRTAVRHQYNGRE